MNKTVTVLQKNNLKMTHARQVVLDLFLKTRTPIAADVIFSYLSQKKCETDRATVYRILDTFVEKGIINRMEFQEGKFRYEIVGSDHHHLICEKCGSIEDISDCSLPKLEKEIRIKKGFLVKRHALEFFGVCASCQH